MATDDISEGEEVFYYDRNPDSLVLLLGAPRRPPRRSTSALANLACPSRFSQLSKRRRAARKTKKPNRPRAMDLRCVALAGHSQMHPHRRRERRNETFIAARKCLFNAPKANTSLG